MQAITVTVIKILSADFLQIPANSPLFIYMFVNFVL